MLFRDPSYEVMYDIYQQYKAENMGRMEHLVLTTMMHNVIGIGSALQKYPFMLEVMTTIFHMGSLSNFQSMST